MPILSTFSCNRPVYYTLLHHRHRRLNHTNAPPLPPPHASSSPDPSASQARPPPEPNNFRCCMLCGGDGTTVNTNGRLECPRCDGSGLRNVIRTKPGGGVPDVRRGSCTLCNGTVRICFFSLFKYVYTYVIFCPRGMFHVYSVPRKRSCCNDSKSTEERERNAAPKNKDIDR